MNDRSANMRAEPRAPLQVIAFLRCASWSTADRLQTTDLSQSGVGVEAHRPATRGEQLRVTLRLPDDSTLHLKGVVRHCTPIGTASAVRSWLIGGRIEHSSLRTQIELLRLLERHRA